MSNSHQPYAVSESISREREQTNSRPARKTSRLLCAIILLVPVVGTIGVLWTFPDFRGWGVLAAFAIVMFGLMGMMFSITLVTSIVAANRSNALLGGLSLGALAILCFVCVVVLDLSQLWERSSPPIFGAGLIVGSGYVSWVVNNSVLAIRRSRDNVE